MKDNKKRNLESFKILANNISSVIIIMMIDILSILNLFYITNIIQRYCIYHQLCTSTCLC